MPIAWLSLSLAQNANQPKLQQSPLRATDANQSRIAAKSPESKRSQYGFSIIGKRSIAEDHNPYSWEAERLLGKKLAVLVERQSQLITDVGINAYLDRLEGKIAYNSDFPGPLTVKIVKDLEPNAFSLPGGLLYVNSGMIIAAENEAELAGVLAHETGHVAARHMTRLITKQKNWKIFCLALGGPAGYLFVKKGLPIFLMRTARNSEFEADLLGLQYHYAAGYDPYEFVYLLRILNEDEDAVSLWDRLTDSHPMTEKRIRRAQTDIVRYLPARNEYLADTSEFHEMKTRLTAIMGIRESASNSADDSKFKGESFQPVPKRP